MPDLLSESLLSAPEAARRVPPTRLDRPTHVSTIIRWITHGVRGVRLEAVRLGGRWVTSVEALDRFAAALTAQAEQARSGAKVVPPTHNATSRREERRLASAEARLTAAGI